MKHTAVVAGIASLILGAQIGVVEAGWGDGPGCGLGKIVFEGESKSILMQNFGFTSNVPSQPFAITSGTSGCTNNGMIVKDKRVIMFVSGNVDNVSQEMAKGQGEYLASLAALMGVPPERQAEFFALAQEIYLDMLQEQGKNNEKVEVEVAPQAVLIALRKGMLTRSIPSNASVNHERM